MKKCFFILLNAMLCFVGSSFASELQEQVQSDGKGDETATIINRYVENEYIKGRLSIGGNLAYRYLTDDDSGHRGGGQGSGTFLGTIYGMDEVQNGIPELFVQYRLTDYISLGVAYTKIEAKTLATTIYLPSSAIKSDGSVLLTGLHLSTIVRYPTNSKFTPYGGVGLGFFGGDFDESDHWGRGYTSPQHYANEGFPNGLYQGKKRWMDIDSTFAYTLTAGATYDLWSHWYLDVCLQYMNVDVNAHFRSSIYGVEISRVQDGTFPLDNIAFRFGIGYIF